MNVIELTDISKSFKYFDLGDVTLNLPQGYILGLIGANGAGKTTLIKIIMGLYHADNGSVRIFGDDIKTQGVAIRDRIVFDNPKYYDFTLRKIKKIIAPFYSHWDEATYNKYMTRFNLKGALRFRKLSRGMKLKFALAIALSHQAELLILDEPTSGLDPIFRIEFLKILQEVLAAEQCSILFSSHITDDIERIADYVVHIKNGHIVFQEDKNNLLSKFLLVKGEEDRIPQSIRDIMIAGETSSYNYEALIPRDHGLQKTWKVEEVPTLEQIMLYHEMRSDLLA